MSTFLELRKAGESGNPGSLKVDGGGGMENGTLFTHLGEHLVVLRGSGDEEAAVARADVAMHGAGFGAAVIPGLHEHARNQQIAFEEIQLFDVHVTMRG